MQQRTLTLLIGVLVVFGAATISNQAAAQDPRSFPVQYMVKFVCGLLPEPAEPTDEEPPLKPGNYATAINIHNYTVDHLPVGKRVALHYRMGDTLPAIQGVFGARIFRFRVLEVDCTDIWRMTGVNPGFFVKGMVHIGLPVPLPVAAVYTAQTRVGAAGAAPLALDPGAGISIDVENINPFITELAARAK